MTQILQRLAAPFCLILLLVSLGWWAQRYEFPNSNNGSIAVANAASTAAKAPQPKPEPKPDPRAAGLAFRLESEAPYKLFTTPTAKLRLSFDAGKRIFHQPILDLEIVDFHGTRVAQHSSTLNVPGEAAVKVPLPDFQLPRLGWYQVNMALRAGDEVLLERVHFIGRTFTNASMPIPDKEFTGWDDLQTHRMVGMRLHRYALHNHEQIAKFKNDIPAAQKMQMPYFVLIIRAEDCTPERVGHVLDKLREYGDEEPLIELVNEPNLNMSAAAYVEILRRCYATIRQKSPRARIMGPSQCGIELKWFEDFFKAGGGEFIDVVSVHTYERHNSMDAYHWNWKFTRIQEILKKYDSIDKPLYQTEHGFMGDYHGRFFRPQWQARQLTLERLVLDRFGINDDQHFYYYVNEGGYEGYSAYLVTRARELLPAALTSRTRTHILGDKKFVRALDFGAPGNWLLQANLYEGAQEEILLLQNTGTLRPVKVNLQAPANARVLDLFGNPQPLKSTLEVGRLPVYVVAPRGSKLHATLGNFGRDIAPDAEVLVDDDLARKGIARLTNGLLEFDFHNQPERVGMLATNDKLPLDLVFEWDQPQLIAGAILYGSLADNDKSTPLEYDLQARVAGQWQTIEEVRVPENGRFVKFGNLRSIMDYDNPWIFRHETGVTADAVRFRFLRTTQGHYSNKVLGDGLRPIVRPRVELREVQIFSD